MINCNVAPFLTALIFAQDSNIVIFQTLLQALDHVKVEVVKLHGFSRNPDHFFFSKSVLVFNSIYSKKSDPACTENRQMHCVCWDG